MAIKMLTYNWRGLTTPEKCMRAQLFLSGLSTPVDIICGQEHKLRSHNTHLLQSIWPTADFLVAPAIDGVCARRNNKVPAGCGGVFLAVGPSLKCHVVAKGIVQSKRAVWMHVDHPQLGRIGLLSLSTESIY